MILRSARAAVRENSRRSSADSKTGSAHVTTRLATLGTVSIGLGALVVLVLDIVTAWGDPTHLQQTISEYGLGTQQWVFSAGVMLLVGGSIFVLIAMIQCRLVALSSVPARAMMLWTVALLTVVAVPKQDWSNDPTIGIGGAIHRIGAVVAFLSIPVAIIAAAWPWIGDARWRVWSRLTVGLGFLSVMSLVPILYAIVVGITTTTPWYRAVTLGYVERGLVVAEVVALMSLALWVRAVERLGERIDCSVAEQPSEAGLN